MRAFVTAFALGVLAAGSAAAADMPMKAVPAPYVQPFYNWNGFYIGGHLGWVKSESSWTTDVFPGVSVGTSKDGILGGGQIGYNWQFNNFVLGIEGQMSGSDLGASRTVTNGFDSLTLSADVNWIASLTGKFGFTANNWLFYMKGGAAWIDVGADATLTLAGIGTFTASESRTRTGWTIGGGVEWGFAPNWSALVEYQFYDFGDRTFTSGALGAPVTVDSDIHTVKLGVNYRFGGGWR